MGTRCPTSVELQHYVPSDQSDKSLAAVSKMTEKRNWVCFGPSEKHIENVATGKRTNLELHNGTSSLDVEHPNEPGFTRLDRRQGTRQNRPNLSLQFQVEQRGAWTMLVNRKCGPKCATSASCGIDGERRGENGVRSHKKMQDTRVPTQKGG